MTKPSPYGTGRIEKPLPSDDINLKKRYIIQEVTEDMKLDYIPCKYDSFFEKAPYQGKRICFEELKDVFRGLKP